MTLIDTLANIGRKGDNLVGSVLDYQVGDVPSATDNIRRFGRAYINELLDDTIGRKEFVYLAASAYAALC